ncbi:MAG TPA: copper chaperone [Oceanospirillales bacterium]|nr:copper chaperone [Oceanospirillales bacterium]
MKKILMLVLFLTAFAAAAEQSNYQLQVNGLACPFCEYNIHKKLAKIDGVVDVKVNLKEGLVDVRMQDGIKLPEAQMKQDITDAGFTLKSIKKLDEK